MRQILSNFSTTATQNSSGKKYHNGLPNLVHVVHVELNFFMLIMIIIIKKVGLG